MEHLRGMQALRERKIVCPLFTFSPSLLSFIQTRQDEARRRALIEQQINDPVSALFVSAILFIVGWYKYGFSRHCALIWAFFSRLEFQACSAEEGFLCSLGSATLLLCYFILLGQLVWLVGLKRCWMALWRNWRLVVVGLFVVGVTALTHFEYLSE